MMRDVTPIVQNMLIINGLVFLIQLLFPDLTNEHLVLYKLNWLGLREFDTDSYFRGYQLVTYFFSHGGFMHILFNMLALWSIGPQVEFVMGSKRFLLYYLFCGFVGGLFITFLDPSVTPVLGSSVPGFGVLLAFALYFPNSHLSFFFIGMPAKWMMLILIAMSLFAMQYSPNSGISHFGHLAGVAAGFLFYFLESVKNRFF